MIRNTAIAILVFVVAVLAFIATRPADFHIERSTSIAAPAARVFPLVNDFHAWRRWSPWERIDPAMQRDYAGAPAGRGAVYSWKGDREAGAGRMTILDSRPTEHIAIRLEFFEPMRTTNSVAFHFRENAGRTHVTWSMDGTNDFIGKAFALLMDLDGAVGKDFDAGLAAMQRQAESETRSLGGD